MKILLFFRVWVLIFLIANGAWALEFVMLFYDTHAEGYGSRLFVFIRLKAPILRPLSLPTNTLENPRDLCYNMF